MEELQSKHRKEQKDLQARITQKKKNATKKTRKGVNDECERLERELKERQQIEIDTLAGVPPVEDLNELVLDDPTDTISVDEIQKLKKKVSFSESTNSEQAEESSAMSQKNKKPNRQKARLARRAAEQEAQAAAAAEEAANQPDLRKQEMAAMEQHKKKFGLTETFIRPDGHCLFSACAKVLPNDVVKKSGPYSEEYQNVRYAAADFMVKHRDTFEPFMEEPFDSYVIKIKDTAEWGGELELEAISGFYKVAINVLQSDGRVEKYQRPVNGTDVPLLWLAYYKHSFGLGEHYNALSQT